MWQSSNCWCTGPAWLALQEKCTETATAQSSQRHHLASHEAITDPRSQRTIWSDAARWEASRWHHHSPLVERQTISLGHYGANAHVMNTAREAEAAANHAATNKSKKYNQAYWPTHVFVPLAIATVGTWHHRAVELVHEIGRRTANITGDAKESTFLFEQLFVAQ